MIILFNMRVQALQLSALNNGELFVLGCRLSLPLSRDLLYFSGPDISALYSRPPKPSIIRFNYV
jgi:hypothetical protein